MISVTRQPIRSSNVREAGYSASAQTLQLQFIDGSVYEYYRRPSSVWRDFQASGSKGSFVQYLTRQGNYRKVKGRVR